jgi:hypothetical protein
LPDGFRYSSDGNEQWLTGDELLELVGNGSGPVELRLTEPQRMPA